MAPGVILDDSSHTNGTANGVTQSATNGATDGATNGATNGHAVYKEPIAIIGISGKFGGAATDPEKLWKMVVSGESAWSPIPKDRFDVESWHNTEKSRLGRNHARGGHFMTEDVGLFDAGFFNLSSDAASAMDPQIRLLLESVNEAFENAGIPLDKAYGSETSVYTGVYGKDYHELMTRDPDALPAAFLTGNGTAMLSNKISHFYNLLGASMTIDTGCSSGLVALHQACHSIRAGESDMSVVGATTTILNPDLYIAMSTLSMVGADGKCYAWDSRAQGYGRGEGIAALVLKRLDQALLDGDHVHAVIRETGLNQDGATKSITSPSVDAQIKLIEKCYSRAGLNMADTGYVEAHMTGTPVGDYAEARALSRTFGKSRKMGDPMYVGSVKTNVGHTESVSGLAGVIKAIYAMENKVIPQNLNYITPTPKFSLQEFNLAVPTALTPWPENKVLRTSINNFGYGGANSHVILDGAPKSTAPTASGPGEDVQSRLYLLSAKDQVAAQGMMGKMATYVKSLPDDSTLGDIAFTLSERRTRFPWVAAVRASGRAELAERLGQKSLKATQATKKPRLGFVLNGQGAQWYAMGRELIAAYPVFEDAIHRADKILKDYGATWSLHEELMRDAKTTRVAQVDLSQPVTVALQLCLLDLLASWNIKPSGLSSHSSGEIAAAYSVGALTFAEALGAAYFRGYIPSRSEELSKLSGGMLAAGISPEDAEKYISDTAEGKALVACINSPDSVTISGDMAALDEVEARLTADGIFARKLKVPLGYHSHHMQLVAKDYLEKLEGLYQSKPADADWATKYRYASPVTGQIVTAAKTLRPDHFVRNMTSPVQFAQAFETMCFDEEGKAQVDVIVEIGAHGTLSGPIRSMLKGREMPYVSTLSRNVDAVSTMQDLAADLAGRGVEVSLKAINSPSGKEQAFVHNLPSYAWNHSTRYWYESRVSKEIRQKRFTPHELIGSLLPGDNGLAPTWRNFLRLSDISWLNDHQIQGYVVLPGAGYVAMAVEATRLLTGPGVNITDFQLKDIEVLNALTVPDSSVGTEVQLNMHPTGDGWYKYQVSSLTLSNTWTINCTGFVRAQTAGESISTVSSTEFFHPGVKPTDVDPESLWSDLRKMSMYHGEVFRPITAIKTARDKAITDITIKDVVSEAHDYVIHPTTLDGIFIAAYNGVPRKIRDAYTVIPRRFKGITISNNVHRKGGEDIVCHSTMHSVGHNGFDSTIAVTNGGDSSDVTILVDHFVAQTLKVSEESDEKPSLISRLEWEADLTSTIPAAFVQSLKIKPEDDMPSDIERKTTRVAFHLIHDAVVALEKSPDKISSRYAALWDWMKSIVDAAAKGELGSRSSHWARTSKGVKTLLTDEVNARGIPSAKLLVRVGQQLPKILAGEVDAAEFNTDNLLDQYYVGDSKLDASLKQLGQLAKQLALNRPGAQVLELYGSTGLGSQAVMEAFGANYSTDGTRTMLGHYDFTDTSEASFDAVKQKLGAWADLLSCKQLDIEKDPKEQGFTAASYDLIVAPVLAYKTGSLQASLGNIYKLLKPGGQVVLIEPTQDQLDHKLVFDVLQESATSTSIDSWEKILREAGFSGIQLQVGDSENARTQFFSVMLAGKPITTGSYPSSVSIVHTGNSDSKQWAQQLSQAIESETSTKPTVEMFSELEVSAETAYIVIPELASPFVANLDRDAFETMKKFLVTAQNILWLSAGGLVDVEEPLIGATNGLLRVLRQEDAGKRCAHLDFAKGDAWTEDKIPYVVNVFKRTFNSDIQSDDQDWEYSVKDSVVFVPRVYPELQPQTTEEPAALEIGSADATYLIIGGMGGIGQHIASWLMEKGAKNLLIVSRSAASSADAPAMKAMAEADNCNLQIRSCDVGNEQSFVDMLAEVATSMPPIRGVVNAAMVLENSILDNMSYEVWQSGIRVKLDSSLNAHKHLTSVDFFIQLSSAIGVPGHPSQAHYAAGNTFQDALARHRAARGLPAVTLNLTAIEGVGWMAQQGDAEQDVVKRIAKVGLTSARIDTVMDMVESAIRDPLRTSTGTSQVILGLTTYDALEADSVTKSDRRFGTLRLGSVRAGAEAGDDASNAKDSLSELKRAAADGSITKAEAATLVVDAVAGKIAGIFTVAPEDIDSSRTLSSYGVDSLVAVELRNWLAASLKAKVSIFDILQSPSIAEFGEMLTGKSDLLTALE